MKYNELIVKRNKQNNRVGRGIAAGQGKTAGRGTKGQKSRTGSSRKPGFEGGANPLIQRLPKLRGFNSHKKRVTNVYTGQINKLTSKSVDSDALFKAGLIENPYLKVKLIVKGELTKAVEVKLPMASESAILIIEKAGGKFIKTEQLGRPKTSKEKTKVTKS
jgi:large subunit ribosomal protein L15